MNYNCHKIGGLTAASLICLYSYQGGVFETYPLNTPTTTYLIPVGIVTIVSYLSSTLPDIDHPQSRTGKRYPRLSRYISQHFGHRGMTHYPSTLLVISVSLYLMSIYIEMPGKIINGYFWGCAGFVGGYASHILLDTFNSAGVPLLAPFSKVRVKIPTGISIKKVKGRWKVCWRYLKGGKTFDEFILVCLCGGSIYLFMLIWVAKATFFVKMI